jgi:hypothetical protein
MIEWFVLLADSVEIDQPPAEQLTFSFMGMLFEKNRVFDRILAINY